MQNVGYLLRLVDCFLYRKKIAHDAGESAQRGRVDMLERLDVGGGRVCSEV